MKTLLKNTTLIHIELKDFELLRKYLAECHYNGFTGINNYTSVNREREFFYRWHLDVLTKKVNRNRGAKIAFLTLNFPELKTLQAMFRRVDCCKKMQELQKKFYKTI